MDISSSITKELKKRFDIYGFVDFEESKEEYNKHVSYYEAWINKNMHSSMHYLKRGLERRKNPKLVFPDLESIVCVGLSYSKLGFGYNDILKGPKLAKYLRGSDYHDVISKNLNKVFLKLSKDFNFSYKVCVDTSAILERAWGEITGIGWIGKNRMLINPKYGSHFFIGVVFLNKKLFKKPKKISNYCGYCNKCLTGCPTKALDEKKGLNSSKCISYLTIEKRGEREDSLTNAWVAGCDICQDLCPFNIKPLKLKKTTEFCADYDIKRFTWEYLLSQSKDDYLSYFKKTALNRIKFEDFDRNLAISLKFVLKSLDKKDVIKMKKNLYELILIRSKNSKNAKKIWKELLSI